MAQIINVQLTQRLVGVDCVTGWSVVTAGSAGSAPQRVEEVLDWFETGLLPLLNAIQSDSITNLSVYGFNVGWGSSPRTNALTGGGALAVTPSVTLPPHLAVYVKESVGDTYDSATGAAYTGDRPIRRGGLFLPGLTEDWIDETGVSVPSALATAVTALFNFYRAPFTGGITSGVYDAAVWSYPKPALPPSPAYPAGKAARPFVHAFIDGMTVTDITRLRSRRS